MFAAVAVLFLLSAGHSNSHFKPLIIVPNIKYHR